MKSNLHSILFMVAICSSITLNAQFLKKLGDRVTDAAENTITRKSAQKTSREVGKGMDGFFESTSKQQRSKLSKPNSKYAFDYNYQMQITTDGEQMLMNYYFKPNSDYAGMAMSQDNVNMFIVFDYDKEAGYTFMKSKNQRMYTSTPLDIETDNDWANNPYTKSDYTVNDLPNKNFLGYTCQGKQIENDEWTFTMYYTDEIEISFHNILNASKDQSNDPSVLRDYFAEAEDAMMMYMKTVDKTGRKNQETIMECVAFEKVNQNFKTKNYQSINY
ncbi:DUF4412 domain-containing protein [Psychroflexus halocasei]|uniref:DUF4412 domain-containing protein n=1 Tax=Psychroflexus halocasei TaxID=908615 RepID=A0A1H4AFC1_9FLAO|nr:DUF4412 domain-containing protein [Psychroflexus halocasei]SEA34783.1 protein of unknown function [Psychroflexus halocasei]